MKDIKLKGNSLVFEAMPYTDPGALKAVVDSKKASALYLIASSGAISSATTRSKFKVTERSI